ncbi:MAG: hypothetical protein CBB68_12320 [Rhodospirillaceae bacterium TMED8]|nr:hypothetical protein [Magnetovibrio sp.]OUT48896.1 MAG: hypothetical protein CBB68_12320 [Rhodospirillaceae bacterium TMED8]
MGLNSLFDYVVALLMLFSRNWVGFALPLCFCLIQLTLREKAGPFWQWHLLDPSYFYLLDALNLINGYTPGHMYHPGVTNQLFGAIVITIFTLFSSISVTEAVLADPEFFLTRISDGLLLLNTLALTILGFTGRAMFGSWVPAVSCQLAPFMSTIILKHAFIPKPESLLVFGTSLMIALSLNSLRHVECNNRISAYFGGLAGFLLATKITAMPVLILPLFLIRHTKGVVVYVGVSLAAFTFFFLPSIGGLETFMNWIFNVVVTTGPYNSGELGVMAPGELWNGFLNILKRPSLLVPMLLTIIVLFLMCISHRRNHFFGSDEQWLIVGVSLAQLAQAILVAKQPTAFYMIPSYMLGAVSMTFCIRALYKMRPIRIKIPIKAETAGAIILVIFLTTQVALSKKIDHQFAERRLQATYVDNNAFASCARIYVYGASALVYAMYLANKVTGKRYSTELKAKFPSFDFWIDDWWIWEPVTLRNWDGALKFSDVISKYPCVYARGTRLKTSSEIFNATPYFKINSHCFAGAEKVVVMGTDCQGGQK